MLSLAKHYCRSDLSFSIFHESFRFSTFCLDAKGGAKKSRQTRTLRAFCLAHAQQHPTAFCIIHLGTSMQYEFYYIQLLQNLMVEFSSNSIKVKCYNSRCCYSNNKIRYNY